MNKSMLAEPADFCENSIPVLLVECSLAYKIPFYLFCFLRDKTLIRHITFVK